MSDIKIIRLQNGEDVVAVVEQDSDHIIVKNPMSMFVKRMPDGRVVMMMLPWIPLEVVEHNIASIHNEDVLTVLEPNKSLIEYYATVVEQQAELELNDFEHSALADSEDYIDTDDYDEETSEEEFEHISRISTKRTYH